MPSHLGRTVFWPGTFAHLSFQVLLACPYPLQHQSIMHFNLNILVVEIEIPTAWAFFVVSLVIFNQTFLLDPGICWQTPFTLDGNFASYFSY